MRLSVILRVQSSVKSQWITAVCQEKRCFEFECIPVGKLRDTGSLFITWQLGHKAKAVDTGLCHTHTRTHNSLLFLNGDTIFAYYLWNLTSKSLLVQDSVCVSLLAAASSSVVAFCPIRRSSILLLISFPYITCDRLSCVPLPYFTPSSARTVQSSWLDGYYLKTCFVRAFTTHDRVLDDIFRYQTLLLCGTPDQLHH